MNRTQAATSTATETFRALRDLLLDQREDYAAAYRDFRWPVLDEFNWALDWFDVIAAGNDRPALRVVEADGARRRCRSPSCRRGRTRSPTGCASWASPAATG